MIFHDHYGKTYNLDVTISKRPELVLDLFQEGERWVVVIKHGKAPLGCVKGFINSYHAKQIKSACIDKARKNPPGERTLHWETRIKADAIRKTYKETDVVINGVKTKARVVVKTEKVKTDIYSRDKEQDLERSRLKPSEVKLWDSGKI